MKHSCCWFRVWNLRSGSSRPSFSCEAYEVNYVGLEKCGTCIYCDWIENFEKFQRDFNYIVGAEPSKVQNQAKP